MIVHTNPQKIDELLTRGRENIYPSLDFLKAKLQAGSQLTLYTGYDPTAATLHIGHGITLLKLREFQDLGHKIIMLIGDFTGMIGDPTDKSSARQKLTREQVLENCKEYKKQAERLIRFDGENPAEIKFNSDWLAKMTMADVVELSSHFTVQQMLERDMFEKRMAFTYICPNCKSEQIYIFAKAEEGGYRSVETGSTVTLPKECAKCQKIYFDKDFHEGENPIRINSPKPIYLHEFLYPLMQGYDSVAMNVDGEIGGNDQTFNMLAGRTLMKEILHKEKFVLTVRLLADESGKKMGKTEGNMIALSDSPQDMFGKVMRWSDGMIWPGFELCTRVPTAEIEAMKKDKTTNPRDFKLRLAYEITKTFLSEEAAEVGKEYFSSVIQSKDKPEVIAELTPSAYDLVTVLVEAKFVKSKTEARQVINQGGVKVDDEKVNTFEMLIKPGSVVQKGSRFFVKII